MKLTNKELSNTHRVIVFGESKSGKTELVGRLSEKYNLLYFDLENGFETLLKFPEVWKDRIELISIPDTKVYPVAIETILQVLRGKTSICDKHGICNCVRCKKDPEASYVTVDLASLPKDVIVVIDSLTQLSSSAMNYLTNEQSDTYKPDWGDYRNQGQLLDKVLSQIQQANYNVVCITHVVETELEDGKKKLVPMVGTSNFSRNSAKYFDHVVYCEVKNKEHKFASSTSYSSSVLTGSRTDVEIEKKAKPSLFDIFCELGTPAEPLDFYAAKPVEQTPLVPTKEQKEASTATKDLLAKLKNKVVEKEPAPTVEKAPEPAEEISEPIHNEKVVEPPKANLTALQKLLQQRREAKEKGEGK